MTKGKWKILQVFQAISDREDLESQDVTIVLVYPMNPDYCGDAYDLQLPLRELKFWENHVDEIFETDIDLDLEKLSSEQLREILKEGLKEKVSFT